MSKDPLDTQGAERELFESIAKLVVGRPNLVVQSVGMNLIVNAIRQTVAKRSDAEAMFDELFGRGKSVLLDVHYDSVTGNRRSVFPFTQVIKAPFHDEGNVIFHGK
jgi:predicted ATPase